MNLDAIVKLSKEIENISKDAKNKLDLISLKKDIPEEDRLSIQKAQEIFSELQVAIENKDINKMNKLLEDANKISI